MNKQKTIIVALFGKSGSGKDTLSNALVHNAPNTCKIINYTTRPRRAGERDGVDYYYISDVDFRKREDMGTLIGTASFNSWRYGVDVTKLQPNMINVGVFNIKAIQQLLLREDLEIIPIYIYAKDYIRLQRSLEREENPDCHEICRRFLADEKDFETIPFAYHKAFDNSRPATREGHIPWTKEIGEYLQDILK